MIWFEETGPLRWEFQDMIMPWVNGKHVCWLLNFSLSRSDCRWAILSIFTHPSNGQREQTLLHSSAVCIHWLRLAGALLCENPIRRHSHVHLVWLDGITEPTSRLELLCLWKTTAIANPEMGLEGALQVTVGLRSMLTKGILVGAITSLGTRGSLFEPHGEIKPFNGRCSNWLVILKHLSLRENILYFTAERNGWKSFKSWLRNSSLLIIHTSHDRRVLHVSVKCDNIIPKGLKFNPLGW